MLRSIPPITALKRGKQGQTPPRSIRPAQILRFRGRPAARPREWRFVTKPFFMRIREPLVDVFKLAKEVQIIVDLGGFTKGEVNFGMTEEGKYRIYGKHGEQEFTEEIDLPAGVDVKHVVENFNKGILELILPKKGSAKRPMGKR